MKVKDGATNCYTKKNLKFLSGIVIDMWILNQMRDFVV